MKPVSFAEKFTKGKVCKMYQDEYKRWLAADLEDADLKPELAKIEETTTRSRTALPLH